MPDNDIIERLRTGGEGRAPTDGEWRSFQRRAHRSVAIRRGGVALALVALGVGGLLGGNDMLLRTSDDRIDTVRSPDPSPSTSDQKPAPPIVVDRPYPNQSISSPLTVSGTADVFEANVMIRVIDRKGRELVETFTTATCGSGCRGEFSKPVSFEVDEEQVGTVEVFWSSAEDGSPQDVILIPVTLQP